VGVAYPLDGRRKKKIKFFRFPVKETSAGSHQKRESIGGKEDRTRSSLGVSIKTGGSRHGTSQIARVPQNLLDSQGERATCGGARGQRVSLANSLLVGKECFAGLAGKGPVGRSVQRYDRRFGEKKVSPFSLRERQGGKERKDTRRTGGHIDTVEAFKMASNLQGFRKKNGMGTESIKKSLRFRRGCDKSNGGAKQTIEKKNAYESKPNL